MFLEISQNSQENTCARVSLKKVAGLRPATLLRKRLWRRSIAVNFLKFLRSFLQNTSGWLLLEITKHAKLLTVELTANKNKCEICSKLAIGIRTTSADFIQVFSFPALNIFSSKIYKIVIMIQTYDEAFSQKWFRDFSRNFFLVKNSNKDVSQGPKYTSALIHFDSPSLSSSYRRCSVKMGVPGRFHKILRKHLCWSLFFKKLLVFRPPNLSKRDSNTDTFLWNLQNFKNAYFEEHLWTTAFNSFTIYLSLGKF